MIFIETTQQLQDSIQDIYELGTLAVDSETQGLDPFTSQLLLVQIGNESEQFLIDTRTTSLEPIKPLLEDKSIIKILANAVFDYKFFRQHDIIMENMIDVLNNERILEAGRVSFHTKGYFALEGLAKRYLNITLDKDVRDSFIIHTGKFSSEQLSYAAEDVKVLPAIWKIQKERILHESLWKTFELESDCLPCFGDMEYNGLYLDKKNWYNIYEDNILKMSKYLKRTKNVFRDVWDIDLLDEVDLNIESNPQMLAAFTKMGYEVSSTKEEIIQLETPKEIHEDLIKYREYKTASSRYGLEYINAVSLVTDRLHPNIWQVGTATGRPSSTKPNMLNIPRDNRYRSCFKAQSEEGMVLTNDYGGQEARIMTEVSQEPSWIDAHNKNLSVHELIGSKIFSLVMGKDITINKSDKEIEYQGKKVKIVDLYNTTKNINFAISYGAGTKRVMQQFLLAGVPCTRELAIEIINIHRKELPVLHEKLDKLGIQGYQQQYSTSLGGRKRFFPRPVLSEMKGDTERERQRKLMAQKFAIERESKNHVIQGTGADMLKKAMVLLRNEIIKLNKQNQLKILLQIYDELVCESEKNHEENQTLIQKCMVQAQEYYQETVSAEVEGNISKSWSK